MPIYSDILKELRREKRMTQTQVAQKLYISQRMYSYRAVRTSASFSKTPAAQSKCTLEPAFLSAML